MVVGNGLLLMSSADHTVSHSYMVVGKMRHAEGNSTQRASMDAGVKTPRCPHLSSHFCISSTSINLIRVLICRRFRLCRP